tara:strand:+ start:158 stop:310 length:153 start_codon:yes stop_codon:yes gene_type:complete
VDLKKLEKYFGQKPTKAIINKNIKKYDDFSKPIFLLFINFILVKNQIMFF